MAFVTLTRLGPTGTPWPNRLVSYSVDPPDAVATQAGAEPLWSSTPNASATQIGAEPIWSSAPKAYATQIGIEVLFPFECITPTPSVVCPTMPDGCPVPAAAAATGGAACPPPAPASVTGDCVAEVPEPLCPQE